VVRTVSAVVGFLRRSFSVYIGMDGFDRAMALAAQAFTALVPLVIVVSATFEGGHNESLGEAIVDRFGLTGSTADTVRSALPTSASVEDSVTLFGAVILVFSALSFTRAMQRMYERAWGLEARGIRDAAYGLLWLAGFATYACAHPALHDQLNGPVGLAFSVAGTTLLWLLTPYVILAKRVHWRVLVPQALLTAAGMTVYRAVSAIYMPAAFSSASEQFGAFGFAFAIIGWLFCAGCVCTGAAAIGAAWRTRDGQDEAPPLIGVRAPFPRARNRA
jgi:membrane protein